MHSNELKRANANLHARLQRTEQRAADAVRDAERIKTESYAKVAAATETAGRFRRAFSLLIQAPLHGEAVVSALATADAASPRLPATVERLEQTHEHTVSALAATEARLAAALGMLSDEQRAAVLAVVPPVRVANPEADERARLRASIKATETAVMAAFDARAAELLAERVDLDAKLAAGEITPEKYAATLEKNKRAAFVNEATRQRVDAHGVPLTAVSDPDPVNATKRAYIAAHDTSKEEIRKLASKVAA